MDDKKLLELYNKLKSGGANIKSSPEQFIQKMKSDTDYVSKVGNVLKSGGDDISPYIIETPELKSANPFDLMREAVSQKPTAEKEAPTTDYRQQVKGEKSVADIGDSKPQWDMWDDEKRKLDSYHQMKRIKEMANRNQSEFDAENQESPSVMGEFAEIFSLDRPIIPKELTEVQKSVANNGEQKEGIVGQLINETYNKAQQKPIVADNGTQKPIKDMQGYEQTGLTPPKKIEKTPEINWGETTYLESTKSELPTADATKYETISAQTDLVNKAISHANEYGEDVWQGNTPIAKSINESRYPLLKKAEKGELSEAQVTLLNKVGKDNPQSQLFIDVATKGKDDEIKQLAINSDDEYAKKVYDESDKAALAKLRGVDVSQIAPEDRMGFWYEKTKGLGKIDMPETIPYQLIANDSKNLQEQLKTISNLFQKETGEQLESPEEVVLSIPTGFGAEFKTPSEKLYAYYQVLGNRFQELTREFQEKSRFGSQKETIEQKDVAEQIKSLAGTALPFMGVEDLKDPKWTEYMRLLNKINALAPLIQKGEAGKTYGEWGDEEYKGGDLQAKGLQKTSNEIGKFAASMWSGVSDMLGYDVLKRNQEYIAQQQQQALAETGGKITPQQQKVLDERMSMEGFLNPKSWGQAGSSLVGMGVIMGANPFSGELQASAKGLQMLSKTNKLFNSEQKLTRLGKIVQATVGLTAAGLETELAGQVSGEGKNVTDELSFGMGATGEAGKMVFGAMIGLIGKGVTKLTPNAVVAQVEKQYGKLSPKARKSIETFATNAGNRLSSGLAKELPEEVAQTAYENYKKYGLDGMMQQTITDIMGENPNWNDATRWAAQIVLMGALDGQPETDQYKLQTWATTMAEKFSGEKVNAELLNEFTEHLKKETENAPTGVKFSDDGVNFTLNNTEFRYSDGKLQTKEGKGVDAELYDKAEAVGQTLSKGYESAVSEGNFEPLFGEEGKGITNKPIQEKNAEIADIEAEIRQNREQNAQTAETPTTQEQEPTQVETAEVAQEAPQVEAVEIEQPESQAPPQKTAEELDARRSEIKPRQDEVEATILSLGKEIAKIESTLDPLADNADDVINELEAKYAELNALQAEALDLADEDTEIATLRQTIRTDKEVLDEKMGVIQQQLDKNAATAADLGNQVMQAMGNKDFETAKQLRQQIKDLATEKESLMGEYEALTKEMEAMQPKKEAVKETLTAEEPVAEIEAPITAETPQLEVSESVTPESENLQKMTDSEKSVTPESPKPIPTITDKTPISEMESAIKDMTDRRNEIYKNKKRTEAQKKEMIALNTAISKAKALRTKAKLAENKAKQVKSEPPKPQEKAEEKQPVSEKKEEQPTPKSETAPESIAAKNPQFTKYEDLYEKLKDKTLTKKEKDEIRAQREQIAKQIGITDIIQNISSINKQLEDAGIITKSKGCP